jgi:hypothetical protein
MNRRQFIAIAGVASAAAIAAAAQVRVYRPCGHKESLYERYFPCVTHCCFAGGLVTDLNGIYFAQVAHHADHGRYAPSLAALLEARYYEAMPGGSQYYALDLAVTPDDWHCTVSRTARLPGYYLLTSDGTIYFSEDHPATTTDLVLSRSGSH